MDERLERARDLSEDNPDEALRLCSQVLNENKDSGEATYIAARIMLLAERTGLAHILFKRCNELNPEHSEILNSIGLSIEHSHPKEALDYYTAALEVDPKNFHALNNKGLMLLRKGRPDLCIKLCDRALGIKPDHVGAIDNRAMAYLTQRRWKEGWRDYRGSLGVSRTRREYGVPEWNGEPGTVVVYGEQGIGDEIIFSSCLPDLIKTNKVILDVDPRLKGLFERSFECLTYGTRFLDQTPLLDENEVDYQISIASLPRFFRNEDGDFPGRPFLVPDPERSIQWRALFDSFPEDKTIGLAWTGGVVNTQTAQRSFDVSMFDPLLELPYNFVSLEYKQPNLEGSPIRHFTRAVNKGIDYDETAAFISELDLVICVATATVHAAGGLGKECWCLVPEFPSYRYHLSGQMPWYDSVKLFRKKGSWEDLIQRVRNSLKNKWAGNDQRLHRVR